MLIPCPDCGREVSDRAISCPQCGAPIAEDYEEDDGDEYFVCPDCKGQHIGLCPHCNGGHQACWRCNGKGQWLNVDEWVTCNECRGRGTFPCGACNGGFREIHCRTCGGTGRATEADVDAEFRRKRAEEEQAAAQAERSRQERERAEEIRRQQEAIRRNKEAESRAKTPQPPPKPVNNYPTLSVLMWIITAGSCMFGPASFIGLIVSFIAFRKKVPGAQIALAICSLIAIFVMIMFFALILPGIQNGTFKP